MTWTTARLFWTGWRNDLLLIDVNVLVYAHRADAARHGEFRSWLEDVVNGDEAYGVSDLVLSGFLRVVTHPRIFVDPSPLARALAFAEEVRTPEHCVAVTPGERHWAIFTRLCRVGAARGNIVPDAYLAALAIEWGCEWITTDRDFSRFSELRWRHPLERRA